MNRAPVIAAPALDMFVRWDPSDPAGATFHSGIDTATGTVRLKGGGVWHQADADRYFEQQRRIVEEARRRYGPVRVFFDIRGWVVEGPQSALQFQTMNAELYRSDDRVAALVGSSLLKQHSRVALTTCQSEAFISRMAAETWLQAYSEQSRQSADPITG